MIQQEIERQCSIGAGTCYRDAGALDSTGLLTVHADLDIATIERMVERLANALEIVAGMTKRQQLPITAQIHEIATAALHPTN